MSHNLFETFAARMRDRSDADFITTREGRRYSYRNALDASARLAGALKALGVAPGDRVAVQVDKSPEAILLYLACLRMGGVYLPLNTGYTADEIRYFLTDAEPALFVCRPSALEEARAVAGECGCPAVETLGTDADGSLMALAERAAPCEDIEPREHDDLAAILYTSGTTGRPKGAMLSHENLASNARTLVEAWRITSQDTLIHALPIFHVHGLFVAIHTMMMAGGRMILLQKFDAPRIVSLMDRATVLMGVPTFYTRLLHESVSRARHRQNAPVRLRLRSASCRNPRSLRGAPATPSSSATA
jgi:malonyl-CoA/methylmalonyl-CoA synthetase